MSGEQHSGSDVYLTAEAQARVQIDQELETAGWAVQGADSVNLAAAQGVAVREFILSPPHGRADYLLFVDFDVYEIRTNMPIQAVAQKNACACARVGTSSRGDQHADAGPPCELRFD